MAVITAFKNASIIDCVRDEPYMGSLVVEGDTLISVTDQLSETLPDSARIIDLNGSYVLPGLIDAHVHVICSEADVTHQMRNDPISLMTLKAQAVLESSLDQGFTTLRDCGGADAGIRTAVESGVIKGPRLKVSGRHLSMTGGHGDNRTPADLFSPIQSPATFHGIVADGVTECRKASRDQLRQGVDFIKIMAGGGCISPADKIDSCQYAPDELSAMVWEADACGTYVSAHCYSDASVLNCITAGVRTIEHGNLMSEQSAAALADAEGYLVPTLSAYHIGGETAKACGFSEAVSNKLMTAREAAFQGLEAALKAGCRIGSGSDILGPAQNSRRALELTLKSEIIGPYPALKSATITNAEMMGMDGDIGTLEPGKKADLIVMDKNPLTDIGCLERFEKHFVCVMKGGVFHKNRC